MSSPGELLGGRYRLDDRIAAGGMGEVWQATDTVLDRAVAVKTLLADRATDPGFQRRFRHEARALAALRHSGVVAVYDFGSTGNEDAYLVMARVDGQPLNQVLASRGRLTPGETMSVVAQAARALEAAHTAGIVHRDVKPGNLLIEPDGTVVLVDFGVARSAHSGTVTGAREVVGTALYIAPEQVTRQQTGPAADVYALGALAYHCLAGRPPFHGDNPIAVALQHIEDEPPPLPDDVPDPVRALVRTALSKDPSARFASAGAMADAADAAVSEPDAALDAAPPVPGPRGAGPVGAGSEGLAATKAGAPWFGIAGIPAADSFSSPDATASDPGFAATPPDATAAIPTPTDRTGADAANNTPNRTFDLAPDDNPGRTGTTAASGSPDRTFGLAPGGDPDQTGTTAANNTPNRTFGLAPGGDPDRTGTTAANNTPNRTFGLAPGGDPDRTGAGAAGVGVGAAGIGGLGARVAPERRAAEGRRRWLLPVVVLVAVAALGLGGFVLASSLGLFAEDPKPSASVPAAPVVSGPRSAGPEKTGKAAGGDDRDRPETTQPAKTNPTTRPAAPATSRPAATTAPTTTAPAGGATTGTGTATSAPPATEPAPGGEETGEPEENENEGTENEAG